MGDPPVPSAGVVPAELAEALKSASDYAAASKSEATRRAYRSDWQDFAAWCSGHGVAELPAAPAALASYIAQLADRGKKVSTIRRRIAAIAYAHRLKGFPVPTDAEPVKAVLSGIRRRIGVAVTRKAPATARALQKMTGARRQKEAAACDLRTLRDRALLLLGFAAALRRSELVALDVADLEFLDRGLIVHIRKSKTDQDGAGAEIAVPNGTKLKPVAAVREWLAAAAIADGPVFRPIGKGKRGSVKPTRLTDKSVAEIVKRYAAAAGFDAATFSGHSMRAGFITSALENGADFFKVMDVSRHRDVDVMRAYDRRTKRFKDHAGKDFL
jgi:site-specific recombinase XerD